MTPLQVLSFLIGLAAFGITAFFAFQTAERRRRMVEVIFTEKPSPVLAGIILVQILLFALAVIFSIPKITIFGAFLMMVTFFGLLKAGMMIAFYKYLRGTFLMLIDLKPALYLILASSAAISMVLMILPWFAG